ncbi:TIR domain-containing protein [Sulfurimonas aquatica]|uniref:TIR domain-containing protein n=1 Tax=Sulfurimonas aquatica TaxID=2672570 RepID=A0A975GDC5_9BACT|nr:TIR domain-containing protein [Sulfurimonas aquatica]QSZ42174.1 TIR domain-containing protein [Sulfurimonas aquatica]
MIKKTIFISYGRDVKNPQHVELVKKVKSTLEKEGFNVLMDIEQLQTGVDWELQLEKNISQSDWILFFITPYSARRPDGYCLNELSFGLSLRKPIAPIMVDFEVAPLSISRIQYLDLQHVIDYDTKIKEILSVLNERKKLGFEGGHTALLSVLDPLKSDTIIAKHIHGFVGREWIYIEVDRWLKEEKNSRVLWITAEAGYGKSALSTFLSEKHPSSTSVHFCQHDYRESRDPIHMLKVLIYELSTQIPEYYEMLLGINFKEKIQGSAENIFKQILLEPLDKIKRPEKDRFFIIDALDEAKDGDEKNPIMELISNHFSALPEWLNIIVTSRPEPELMRKLKKFNPIELKANNRENFDDLEKFIFQTLPELEASKVQALLNKSEGNILFLKKMLELENIKDDDFRIEDIEKLPIGMEGFYQQFFERKFDDIELYEEVFLDLVSIIVSSQEGLPSFLITYILEMGEREYNKKRASFGSLLEEHNSLITFYHKSLFDWLSDYSISGDYSADINKGNQLLANKLWQLYQEDQKKFLTHYEHYLLQALYEIKAYDKLEIILQDICFIKEMFSNNKELVYKDILDFLMKSNSIKMDSKYQNISFIESWPNGSILSSDRRNIFIWSKKGELQSIIEGHTGLINGIQILDDGRILSYSNDATMRIYSPDGILLVIMQGHTDRVNGIEILNDNRILSYSWDTTLRLWSPDGMAVAIMCGHSDCVNGVEILNDGRILSYSYDNTLRLWSSSGKPLVVMEGHTSPINIVEILADGRIISSSVDNISFIWSSKGELLEKH